MYTMLPKNGRILVGSAQYLFLQKNYHYILLLNLIILSIRFFQPFLEQMED